MVLIRAMDAAWYPPNARITLQAHEFRRMVYNHLPYRSLERAQDSCWISTFVGTTPPIMYRMRSRSFYFKGSRAFGMEE